MNKLNFLGYTAWSSNDENIKNSDQYKSIYQKAYTKPNSSCGFWLKGEFEKLWDRTLT